MALQQPSYLEETQALLELVLTFPTHDCLLNDCRRSADSERTLCFSGNGFHNGSPFVSPAAPTDARNYRNKFRSHYLSSSQLLRGTVRPCSPFRVWPRAQRSVGTTRDRRSLVAVNCLFCTYPGLKMKAIFQSNKDGTFEALGRFFYWI
jgi:hypothetical protein